MSPRDVRPAEEFDRLIRIGELVIELWEEVERGPQGVWDPRNGGGDDSPHDFSD